MLKKTFFLLACVAALVLGGSFFFSSSSPLAHNALKALQEGNILEVHDLLTQLEKKEGAIPLYWGYVHQAMGQFKEAQDYFECALVQTHDMPARQELYCALALNALNEKCYDAFSEWLLKSELEDKFATALSSEALLLKAIEHYHKKDYSAAAAIFATYHEELAATEETSWLMCVMEKTLDARFGTHWIDFHVAHCLIEEGEIDKAREILEQHTRKEASLLLGLSYLKEAQMQTLSARSPYHKAAIFYFEQAPYHFEPLFDKACLISQVERESESLIKKDIANPSLFHFLRLLDVWQAHDTLALLSNQCAHEIFEEKEPKRTELFNTISHSFAATHFATLVNDELIKLTLSQFKDLENDDLSSLKDKLVASCFVDKKLTQKIAILFQDEIQKLISCDDAALSKTALYLHYWKEMEKNPKARIAFYNTLAHQGKLLWLIEGEEQKGTRLLEIVLQMSEDQKLLCDVELFFKNLATAAENANLIHRLNLIFDAFDTLALSPHAAFSPETVANYLADAEYLFKAHHYPSAHTHAEFVLKCDPGNQEALRLLGLTYYHMGQHEKAFALLQQLPVLDDYAMKAYMLLQAKGFADPKQHLVQVDLLNSLDESP